MNKLTDFLSKEWLALLLLIAPAIYLFLFWEELPAKVATHFDINMQPDAYTNKGLGYFFLPALNLALYIFLLFIPRIDPKRKIGLTPRFLRFFRILIVGFNTMLFVFMFSYHTDGWLANYLSLPALLVFFFLVIGNFLSKLRPNYFLGIRTPWTLENDAVWVSTHRFAAKLWVVASLLMILLYSFLPASIKGGAFLTYVLVIGLIPVAYSYIFFQQLKKAGS